MNESCLFLNIATPSSALIPRGAPLPVMLWIHGGGYKTGWTNDFDLPALVRASQRRVVVVSCSYRLSVFGFAASAALSQRTHGQGSGSFGIMDQRLAMQWVRDHIAPFGGNGSDITIFGQSAGGNSVLNHLVQSDSAGLFSKAIIQSGAYDAGTLPMAQAEATFAATLAHTRCGADTGGSGSGSGSVACLLALDADGLLAAGAAASTDPTAGFGPTVDGVSLSETPLALIEAGRYDKSVPVVRKQNTLVSVAI